MARERDDTTPLTSRVRPESQEVDCYYSDQDQATTVAAIDGPAEEVQTLSRITREHDVPILPYWRDQERLPLLRKVARRILAVQCTSAEAERTFR